MIKLKRKIGIGSISLLLFILGFLFMVTFKNGVCIGDNILNLVGLKAWSKGTQGTHYTMFYSPVFFIPSIIIGWKFKEDFGSKVGLTLSLIVGTLIILAMFFMVKL